MADVKVYRKVIADEDANVPPLAILTRIIVPPLGNLLGLILLSLPLWPFGWFDELGRTGFGLVSAGGALLSVPIDVLFRRRRRDQPARVRWFSPYEGGTLFLVPSWIAGPILAGLVIWLMLAHPHR